MEPAVCFQHFVLGLLECIFQPLLQRLDKAARVDVVCWAHKPQHCREGKKNKHRKGDIFRGSIDKSSVKSISKGKSLKTFNELSQVASGNYVPKLLVLIKVVCESNKPK